MQNTPRGYHEVLLRSPKDLYKDFIRVLLQLYEEREDLSMTMGLIPGLR